MNVPFYAISLGNVFIDGDIALSTKEKEERTIEFLNLIKQEDESLSYDVLKKEILKSKLLIRCKVKISDRILEKLSTLTWLTELTLSNNQLTSLPESFGNLAQLKALNLSNNQLTSLPESFGNLIQLQGLNISGNQLISLPISFGNLIKLQHVRLSRNQLISLPESFGNLQRYIVLIDIHNNPNLRNNGEGSALGEIELQRIFGDRIILPHLGQKKYYVDLKTKEQIYTQLDEQDVSFNRETLQHFILPHIPNLEWDGETFMQEFEKVLSLLVLEGENALSYALLVNDFQIYNNNNSCTNKERIEKDVFPRLRGYLKTLWNLSVLPGEEKGWQMYEGSIPEVQRNLSYIISIMNNAGMDNDVRHVLISTLTHAIFHCPTGQKEGIEAILLYLTTSKVCVGLQNKIAHLLAITKEMIFKSAILPGNNGQNVHVLNYYTYHLKEELGLNSYFTSFEDKIGMMGRDPFQNSLGNALEAFYAKFTPHYVIKILLNNIENDVDFEAVKFFDENYYTHDIEKVLNQAKEDLKKSNIERPIRIADLLIFINEQKWDWSDIFENDPMGDQYPKVKPEGIQKILLKLTVLKEKK